MSAFLYGRFEARREASHTGMSTESEPPGLKTYADALMGLVPGEVLAAAAVLVAVYTDTQKEPNGDDVMVVTHPDQLEASFYGLFLAAILFYVAGHVKLGAEASRWDKWDFVRMFVPAFAFVGWAMAVRPSTLFDAAFSADSHLLPAVSEGWKIFLIVFGGLVLAAAAAMLGMAADKKDGDGDGGNAGGGNVAPVAED